MAGGCHNFAAKYPWTRVEVFCIVAVCCALWSAHVRSLREQLSGEASSSMNVSFVAAYNVAALILCFAAAFFGLKAATGAQLDCMPRKGVDVAMARADPVRRAIAERVAQRHPKNLIGIASGLTMPAYVLVTPDGIVAVVGESPSVVAVFTPALENGSLKWICTGEPAALLPDTCRQTPKASTANTVK